MPEVLVKTEQAVSAIKTRKGQAHVQIQAEVDGFAIFGTIWSTTGKFPATFKAGETAEVPQLLYNAIEWQA